MLPAPSMMSTPSGSSSSRTLDAEVDSGESLSCTGLDTGGREVVMCCRMQGRYPQDENGTQPGADNGDTNAPMTSFSVRIRQNARSAISAGVSKAAVGSFEVVSRSAGAAPRAFGRIGDQRTRN